MFSNHPESARQGFQYSLENLRGLSILFVILSHISNFSALGPFGSYLSFFFGDATTWFVFLAGYLFNHVEQRKFDYRAYLVKKAKFVVLPYLILSIPAICAGLLFSKHHILDLSVPAYVAWSLLVGGSVIVPMWFVPMIVIFFLCSPMFHRLGTSRCQGLVLAFGLVTSLFTTRPVDNLNPGLQFVHFAGFYILGVVFSANKERMQAVTRNRPLLSGVILVSSTLFVVSSILFLCQSADRPHGFFDGLGQLNYSELGKLTSLIVLFFLFDRLLNFKQRFLGWLAEISFGLFFVHGFFMAVFVKLSQSIPLASPMSRLGVELTLVMAGSILTVAVAKKALGKWSRYVIGC